MLHRSGAKGVSGGNHHFFPGGAELAGQLANGRRLARAIHPHHQNHLRLLRIKRQGPRHGFHDAGHLVGQGLPQLGCTDLPAKAALGDIGRDAGGGFDPHVGLNEQILKAFQHRIIQDAARFFGLAKKAAQKAWLGRLGGGLRYSGRCGRRRRGSGRDRGRYHIGSHRRDLSPALRHDLFRNLRRFGHQSVQPLADLVRGSEHPFLEFLEEGHGQVPLAVCHHLVNLRPKGKGLGGKVPALGHAGPWHFSAPCGKFPAVRPD